MLGEDPLAVDHDVKNAATARNEFRLDAELFLDFRRQTGSAGVIVSLGAVGDRNLHCRSDSPRLGSVAPAPAAGRASRQRV